MIPRDASCLTIDTFPKELVKTKFLLLLLSRCLFTVIRGNKCLPTGSKINFLSITITENVSVGKYMSNKFQRNVNITPISGGSSISQTEAPTPKVGGANLLFW